MWNALHLCSKCRVVDNISHTLLACIRYNTERSEMEQQLSHLGHRPKLRGSCQHPQLLLSCSFFSFVFLRAAYKTSLLLQKISLLFFYNSFFNKYYYTQSTLYNDTHNRSMNCTALDVIENSIPTMVISFCNEPEEIKHAKPIFTSLSSKCQLAMPRCPK